MYTGKKYPRPKKLTCFQILFISSYLWVGVKGACNSIAYIFGALEARLFQQLPVHPRRL